MTQSIDQRINYHPNPKASNESDRKVLSRLKFISTRVDLRDKTVLDLGCSGGFFSFEISKVAKKVIAVDADKDIITRNKELQAELGIKNIDFILSDINKDIIRDIGAIDVTLFLSVFHHMLTGSNAYDWNNSLVYKDIVDMLNMLNQNTSKLVFEMGEVDEGYEWCERMPLQSRNNEEFVKSEVFRGVYKNITVYNRTKDMNFLNAFLLSKLGRAYKEDTRLISIIKRVFSFDARDLRKIYIGEK